MSFASVLKSATNQSTLQTQPSRNTPVLQVKNNAGGFVFKISAKKQLDRFLLLGTSGGTYYQSEKSLTAQNMDVIIDLIKSEGEYVVSRVTEVSDAGRAKNNDYALLVMALCFTHGNDKTKILAKEALPKVARIGTHILHFAAFVDGLRGWGDGLKKAVSNWYNSKPVEVLAYQMLKYQDRDGWSQVDVIRSAHPKPVTQAHRGLFKYFTKGYDSLTKDDLVPELVNVFEDAKSAPTKRLIELISLHNLSMEMLPTEAKNNPDIWKALLPNLGAEALLRNLNKMTSLGLIAPLSDTTSFVCEKLRNREWIRRSRLHPLRILVAQRVYASGQGLLGSLRWNPDQNVVAALEDAFYLSFDSIEPSGKRRFLALDVSGSMGSPLTAAPQISCAEASAVMAMVALRTESSSVVYGFSHQFVDLGINRNMTLSQVMRQVYSRNFGATDCALPMTYALSGKIRVDQFEIYTDNETYFGGVHPFEALKQYRKAMHIPDAKLAVIAMTPSQFSIADPSDENMMDFVGFDTSTPAILSDFAAGRL